MYTSLFSVLAFTATVLAGKKVDFPACQAPAKSCSKLNAKATASCWDLISKNKIAVSTCEVPSTTWTSTVTVQPKPKTTVTEWAATTTTLTTTQNVNVTLYETSVTTAVWTVMNTLTESATTSLTTTENVNVTSTVYQTNLATITSTSTKDQTKETCAPKKRDNIGKRGWNVLPSDCSCFLTSTTTLGSTLTTATVTSTPTVTMTTTISVTATVTSTWSITVPVTSTASSLAIIPTTTTTTLSVTETATATWTLSSTSTSTSTVTVSATTTLDACAAAPTIAYPPISNGVTSANAAGAKSFKDCCAKCFAASDCVYYEFDKSSKCTLFTKSKKSTDCVTESCPKGKQDITFNKRTDGNSYGLGACVGSYPSWS